MILEKIDTSKPEWLPLDPWIHNKDLCRKTEGGSRGFGSTDVSEPIPDHLRPARAASTPMNKFSDLAQFDIPTHKSKVFDLDQASKSLKQSSCS
eukprot:3999223-Karenia_brevis.AAC.1